VVEISHRRFLIVQDKLILRNVHLQVRLRRTVVLKNVNVMDFCFSSALTDTMDGILAVARTSMKLKRSSEMSLIDGKHLLLRNHLS
jgi:hypothetical protein